MNASNSVVTTVYGGSMVVSVGGETPASNPAARAMSDFHNMVKLGMCISTAILILLLTNKALRILNACQLRVW